MARTRNIKPSFFKDEELVDLGPYPMLCFAGLWTLADREGRLEDRPRMIKAEIFPYTKIDVEKVLQALATGGFIVRYEHGGEKYIQVRTFKKHQNPNVKEPASTIPTPTQHSASTVPAPNEHISDTASNLKPLTSNPKPLPTGASPDIDLAAEFERAWSRWPSRGRSRRPLCETNWSQSFGPLFPECYAERIQSIHVGIDKWLNSKQFAKGFVFAFADFIAQRRWQEEPEQVESQESDIPLVNRKDWE